MDQRRSKETVNAKHDESGVLRGALLANCVFSGLCGTILLVGSDPLSRLLGLHMPTILMGVGVLLLVYAAALLLNARRVTVCQTEASLAVVFNMALGICSIGLMLAGSLSTAGNWTVTLVGNVVLLFAAFQFYAIRRLRREGAVCELK